MSENRILMILFMTVLVQSFILYQTLTVNEFKDSLRLAQERLMEQTFGSISYMARTSSFYLYT